MDGKRWYHRFSALTARAGGFDVVRDVLKDHGPLGALYPNNTTHPQKEGDTLSFLYYAPTGMDSPESPGWGGWGGRFEHVPLPVETPVDAAKRFEGRYFWANQADTWKRNDPPRQHPAALGRRPAKRLQSTPGLVCSSKVDGRPVPSHPHQPATSANQPGSGRITQSFRDMDGSGWRRSRLRMDPV